MYKVRLLLFSCLDLAVAAALRVEYLRFSSQLIRLASKMIAIVRYSMTLTLRLKVSHSMG
jgi:hypothetical protein